MVRAARNRRKQLTPQSLSGVAEVCETRSLLCATGFEAPVAIVGATASDASEVQGDVVATEDGMVADEVLFSIAETGTSEEDFQLAICNLMPMEFGETEEFALELTEKTNVVEDVTVVGEATEFVDYETEAMPTDWDPSWGYRFLSITAAPVEELNGEVPVELLDSEITGEIVDLSLLDSVHLPAVDDSMMYTMTFEDTVNPDDLLATCFTAPPSDELVEPGTDGVELKDDVIVAMEFDASSEDWTSIPPEILMTMVMRGNASDAGDEDTVVDKTTEDGVPTDFDTDFDVVTQDGEEIWLTGIVDGTEDLPPIMYMFGDGGVVDDGSVDVVEVTDDGPVDGEVPTDEIDTMTAEADELPVDLLPEDSELIFRTAVLEDVPPSVPNANPSDEPAPPIPVHFHRSLFVEAGDDEAIGTLLSRPGSQTGPVSTTPRTASGPAIRTAAKLNAVATRRSVPPASLPNLTSPLGNNDESEAVDSDDDHTGSSVVSANTKSTSTNDAATQQAANVASANRTRSIDLFMSQFHDEFFAG